MHKRVEAPATARLLTLSRAERGDMLSLAGVPNVSSLTRQNSLDEVRGEPQACFSAFRLLSTLAILKILLWSLSIRPPNHCLALVSSRIAIATCY